MNNKIIFLFVILLFFAGGIYLAFRNPETIHDDKNTMPAAQITNFNECAAAGYPVEESYPARCATPDGKHFTENIGNEIEMIDIIKIDGPRPNTKIASPLKVTGQARGIWYFEAVFPINLLDANGNVIATGQAQAQGDWMTEDFVPFAASLEFTTPGTSTGTLILKKDNPSGLPENDKSLDVPVKF